MPNTAVVAGGRRSKDDRKQNTLVPSYMLSERNANICDQYQVLDICKLYSGVLQVVIVSGVLEIHL